MTLPAVVLDRFAAPGNESLTVSEPGSSDSGSTAIVTFDTQVYPIEVVKKAAYKYLNTFLVDFRLDGLTLICSLSFPQGTPKTDQDHAVADLKNEVLDQDLRERIRVETAPIRNLILAHAFSKAGLITDEQVSRD